MRIMIVSSTYAPAMNGQAVFTTSLAEGLVKLGHSVMVVMDSHHDYPPHSMVNGVHVEEIRSVSLGFLHSGVYFSPFPGKEVKRLVQSFQPQVIHIQDHYPTCRAAAITARNLGIRLVGTNHFIPDNLAPYIPVLSRVKPLYNWLLWQWMLEVYRRADAVAAQSGASATLLRSQKLQLPIQTISCGIDLNRFHRFPPPSRLEYRQKYGIDPLKKVFLFLGRIDGEKRVDSLLRAMEQLHRDDTQLVVAGKGGVEEELHRMAIVLDITDKVRFTGFIPEEDVPGLMSCADVFVMPSEAELLSISTLEAMACERPVLLADALALPELVREGKNGYLFKPGDIGDLVHWMGWLADHAELWPAMGVVSREIASAHSLDLTLRKYDSLYTTLLRGVRPSTAPKKAKQIIYK